MELLLHSGFTWCLIACREAKRQNLKSDNL